MNKEKDPIIERKPDLEVNGNNIDAFIAKQREREKNLYPIRVTSTTVIYVTKNKATKEYAEQFKRDKMMRL